MAAENKGVIAAWNTVLFDKFCRFKYLLTDGLAAHSDEALARCGYAEGARVLDIGCGFGDSAQRIAKCVGPRGEVLGVDCAENFIKVATQEASEAGIDNASFFEADVQTDNLRGPYDLRSLASGRCSSRCPAPPCAIFGRRSSAVPG